MVNYKAKSKTSLKEWELIDLLNLVKVRTERSGKSIRNTKKILRGHPFNGDPDQKSKFVWLWGEHPDTVQEVGKFFLILDRAIMDLAESGLFPHVTNVVWWTIEDSIKVLQVYLTHDRTHSNHKQGTFLFMGGFFPEHDQKTYPLARSLADAYAREWGQKVQEWETLTPWSVIEGLNLYAWHESGNGVIS